MIYSLGGNIQLTCRAHCRPAGKGGVQNLGYVQDVLCGSSPVELALFLLEWERTRISVGKSPGLNILRPRESRLDHAVIRS